MGVEKDGLGSLEVLRVFYEIKDVPGACLFIQGYPGNAQEGPACLQACFRCFITMKLQ